MKRNDLFDEVAKMALEQAKKKLCAEPSLNDIDSARALVEIAAIANAEEIAEPKDAEAILDSI